MLDRCVTVISDSNINNLFVVIKHIIFFFFNYLSYIYVRKEREENMKISFYILGILLVASITIAFVSILGVIWGSSHIWGKLFCTSLVIGFVSGFGLRAIDETED